jgi:5'-3' exonuclease
VRRPLLLVDGDSMLFRAFFALPDSIEGADGRAVNALLGMANLVLREIEAHGPRATVVCFGQEAAHYRVELFSGYHAERPELPEKLAEQFAAAPGFFRAFGWTVASSDSLEADDLLGALASGPHVEDVDAAEVERRYGVPPHLVPDFIALRGDPSDGIPGAKGIGEKTAAALLARHGSLEGALAGALAETSVRVRTGLLDGREDLLAYKEVATLRDVEVELPPDRELDRAGAARAARELGMNRLGDRLEGAAPSRA